MSIRPKATESQSKKDTKSIKKAGKTKAARIPYHKKPDNLSLENWQAALRRQFAEDNPFNITNLGMHPVYSDYAVYNPATQNRYKVAIRSQDNSANFCTCLDFKTNGLGTCKHVEAVLQSLKRKPKLKKLFKEPFTPPYTSVYLKYGTQREVRLRLGTENREAFEKLAKKYFDKNLTLQSSAFDRIEQFIEKGKAIHPDFRCYSDALEYIIDVRRRNYRSRLLNEKLPEGPNSPYFNHLLKTTLFPYQKQGIFFAARAGRCLLADDMGLGKTIQAIGTAELMRRELGISKVLIVCPTSLKYQWKSEISKFTDSTVSVIEGMYPKRSKQYEAESFYKIVTYNVVGNDIAEINRYEPDLVILDEAQRIKNWKTKTAQNVKKVQSDYAVVLTGTPLENKLEELYSIIQFVDNFRLGSLYKFTDRYQIKDETNKVIGYRNLNEISHLLSDLMIRRRKKEVLKQLPKRVDKNLFVPMTEEQAGRHSEFADVVARLVNKWRRIGFLDEKDRQKLLINLNCMRMVCDSTYVLDQDPHHRHDTKIDELMSILEEVLESDEEKVVIFSQWERMTRLVATELEKRQVQFEYLHGGVPSDKRQFLLDNFANKPESKVFLSTDAGGVGLNLQAASLLINLDIPWNPAVLEQRIGRIYRLGQKRNVSIINLVATGTIEHRMLDVLKFKSSLAGGVLDGGEDSIFLGDDRFKQFMNSVEQLTETPETEKVELMDVAEVDETSSEVVISPPSTPLQPAKASAAAQTFADDDDVAAPVEEKTSSPQELEVADIFSTGMQFFSKLAKTLAEPESAQALVNSLVEKDNTTGKSYLKIPVENEQVVTNALSMLSGLFKAFQK